jgi:hypothetical protein
MEADDFPMKGRRLAWGGALAGLLACTGMIGDGNSVAQKPTTLSASSMRRLSRVQYQQSVFDLIGVTVDTTSLPEDVKDPFDDDAISQLVSPALIAALEQLDGAAAPPPRRSRQGRRLQTDGPTMRCFKTFVTSVGALRRR